MRRVLCGLWAALTLACPPLHSSSLDGLTVVGVDFDPSTQPVTSDQLPALVAVKPGEPLDVRLVRQTIHNLYATGRYKDVEVEATRAGDGVRVTFVTQPSWFIGLVGVTGVPGPPTPGHLINVTELEAGEPHSEEKTAYAEQQIRGLLKENGFYLAGVEIVENKHPEYQQIDVVFEVDAGERAGLGEVIVAPDPRLTLSADELRRIAKWREDKPLTQRRVRRGLERIEKYLQQRHHWQAQARKVDLVYDPDVNRVDVVLHIVPGPRVMVRLDGADFSPAQLQKYLPIFEEGDVDEDLLSEGASNLRDYLQTQGYFSASVEHFLVRDSEEEVHVVYRVERGPRQRLSSIRIAGNRYFDLETIRERLLIQEKTFQQRRGRFSQSLLERDVGAIEELYRTNGFRDVKVTSRVNSNFGGKTGNLAVFLTIEEGPLTLVSDLTILGTEQIPVEEFLPELSSARGQPFSEINVATDRDLILGYYYDEGFQDARFGWRYDAAGSPNRVSVEYKIEEGEPLRVRGPIVSGLHHTRETLVDRQIRIFPDEPLSQTAMLETQRRLYDLGVFSKVDVDLQNPDGEEPSKNVLVQVEEARRWSVGVGGGAEFARIGGNTGDLTSPVGNASFSPRVTLEFTRLNLRGKGHTASLRTRFSDLQQRALFTYENPRWTGSDRWRMTVSSLFDTSRNVRTFTGQRLEGAFQLHHKLSKPSTALYRFTYRRTSIDENSLQISPGLIPRASQPVRVGLLGGTYIQDRRDEPTDATKGLYNTVDLGLASGAWASEPDFFRILGQNSSYHRLPGRLIVARTLQLGFMFPWGEVLQVSPDSTAFPDQASNPDLRIPLSERFFFGGANSHRGFPINQAGPRDPVTGFPIGGGAVLLNSVELRFPLVGENIGGVLFHDAGNAYSRPGRISFRGKQKPITVDDQIAGYEFDYMVHAVGFGLRYRTPIGPIRLDLGYSVNPPRFIGFEGTRQELLAGQGMTTQQRISHFQFHFSLGQTF